MTYYSTHHIRLQLPASSDRHLADILVTATKTFVDPKKVDEISRQKPLFMRVLITFLWKVLSLNKQFHNENIIKLQQALNSLDELGVRESDPEKNLILKT